MKKKDLRGSARRRAGSFARSQGRYAVDDMGRAVPHIVSLRRRRALLSRKAKVKRPKVKVKTTRGRCSKLQAGKLLPGRLPQEPGEMTTGVIFGEGRARACLLVEREPVRSALTGAHEQEFRARRAVAEVAHAPAG